MEPTCRLCPFGPFPLAPFPAHLLLAARFTPLVLVPRPPSHPSAPLAPPLPCGLHPPPTHPPPPPGPLGTSSTWLCLHHPPTHPGLRLLLRHFNHSLPYAISDHLGDHNKRGYFVPSPYAAVCLPCHWEQLLPPPAPRRNASASAGAAADGGNSSDSSAGSSGSSSDSHLHPDAGGAAWNATTSSSSLGAVRHLLEGAVGAAGGGVADAYPAAGGAAGIGDGLAASRAAAGGRDFGDLDDGEQSPGNDGGALGLSPQLNQEALAAAADERKSVALLLRLQQQEKADPRRSLVPLPGCPCSQALACKHRARVCRRRACTDAKGFRGDMKVCRWVGGTCAADVGQGGPWVGCG